MKNKTRLAELIRVDQAGEAGAKAIYQGQQAVLRQRDPDLAALLAEQQAQEEKHLAFFDQIISDKHIRPSAFLPLWEVGGFALGALTALIDPKAAHSCTLAVEEVIAQHYGKQIEELEGEQEEALRTKLTQFRAEEIAHGEEAEAAGAREAPAFPVLHQSIGFLVRTAIRVAEKI